MILKTLPRKNIALLWIASKFWTFLAGSCFEAWAAPNCVICFVSGNSRQTSIAGEKDVKIGAWLVMFILWSSNMENPPWLIFSLKPDGCPQDPRSLKPLIWKDYPRLSTLRIFKGFLGNHWAITITTSPEIASSVSRFSRFSPGPWSAKAPSAGAVECSKAVARQIQNGAFGNHHLIVRRSVKFIAFEKILRGSMGKLVNH